MTQLCTISASSLLAAAPSDAPADYTGYFDVGVKVVLAAIALIGILVAVVTRDLSRFRLRRVRAIANVCFSESIRRRILWITPLAIVGIVAVSQLTRPADEQDAVRQTIKYCLFASGLIVIVAAVILAATNLPKEIESRVIFTVVTKPTTRLEIVLGKVLGFAQVSGMILLIMGVFTWGYLRLRASHLQHQVQAALKANNYDPNNKQTLEHYANAGLLETRSLEWPKSLEVYSRVPSPKGDGVRWIGGGRNQFYTVPFKLTDQQKQDLIAAAQGGRFVLLMTHVDLVQHPATPQEEQELRSGRFPLESDRESLILGPFLTPPEAAKDEPRRPLPQVSLGVTNSAGQPVAQDVFGHPLTGPRPAAPTTGPTTGPAVPGAPAAVASAANPEPAGEPRWFPAELAPGGAKGLEELVNLNDGSFLVEVGAATPTMEYGAGPQATVIGVYDWPAAYVRGVQTIAGAAPVDGTYLLYAKYGKNDDQVVDAVALKKGDKLEFTPPVGGQLTAYAGDRKWSLPDATYFWLHQSAAIAPAGPAGFQGRFGRSGVMVRGEAPDTGRVGSVGVYHFDHVDVDAGRDRVTLQLRLNIERAGDLDAGNATSRAAIRVRNSQTGEASPEVEYLPETGRFAWLSVDGKYLRGGEFDVLVRGLTPGQWLGLQGPTASVPSAGVVTAEGSALVNFEVNLFKSLFILWLLAVLVVVIALFCSTFLSWPIAVVLTLLLLLGRWGVNELGDALDPGAGRNLTSEFGFRRADQIRVASGVVEGLATMLRTLGKVLPDVTRFPVSEDIDRGVNIPWPRVGSAAGELALYGVPLLMLTYLIFRRKEVAP